MRLVETVELDITVPDVLGWGPPPWSSTPWGGGIAAPSFPYRYAHVDVPKLFPGFVLKLANHLQMNRDVPGPGVRQRSLISRTVRAEFSDIDRDDTTRGPTPSYLLANGDIVGGYGRARIHNADDLSVLFEFVGRLSEVGERSATTVPVEITNEDDVLRETLVPKRTTLSVFPSADTGTVQAQDHPIVIPFGYFPAAQLAQVMSANYADVLFSVTGAEGDKFIYLEITNIADTPISTGYFLEYDVWWDEDEALIGMDLECSDGTKLRLQSVNDQNGFAATPATDISSKCTDAIYRRRISLASLVGKTVTKYKIGTEANTAGSYSGKIGQAVIVDTNNTIVREIITRNLPTLTTATAETSNGGNSGSITKDNHYYSGAILDQAQDTTLRVVYRNGLKVQPEGYDSVWFLGLRLVRFDTAQVDAQGNAATVHVDIDTERFERNAALVGKFFLRNSKYGARQRTDTASFTTAAAAYESLGLTIGGGLDRQRPLGDLLDDLHMHGSYLWRRADAAYQWLVDTAASHTDAAVDLEDGPLTGRKLNNAEVRGQPIRLRDRRKKYVARGFLYRGLTGNESWLLRTTRERDVLGVEETRDYPYILDPMVLDKVAHYDWEEFQAWERQLSVQVGRLEHAVQLGIGQKTDVFCRQKHLEGVEHKVVGIAVQGLRWTFTLVPFRAASYVYAPGTDIFIDPKATRGTDYSQTPPSAPINFTIDETVTRITAEGLLESIVTVKADAPTINPENISDIIFRLTRRGTVQALQEIPVQADPLDTDLMADFTLQAGQLYTLRAFSRNSANLREAQNGAFATSIDVDGPINATPPASPSNVAAAAGILIATITWDLNTEADMASYGTYRGPASNGVGAALIGSAEHPDQTFKDTNFSANDVPKTVYYWVSARNSSGTESLVTGPVSVTVDKVATTDVGDNAITTADSTSSAVDVTLPSSGAETTIATITLDVNGGFVDVKATVSLDALGNSGPTILRIRRGSLAGTVLRTWSSTGFVGSRSISTIDNSPGVGSVDYLLTGQSSVGESAIVDDHELSGVNNKR